MSTKGMQKRSLILFLLVTFFSVTAFTPRAGNFPWMNLSDVKVKLKQQNKPVLIDLYTDWCHWCKVMDKKTYSNSKVVAYINEHFYSAKVNAETKDNVSWKDKTYKYNSKYQINDFALFVTYGRTSFPTTVIIADNESAPIPIAGYMEPREIEPILKYFGGGAYKTMNFKEFEKTFRSSW